MAGLSPLSDTPSIAWPLPISQRGGLKDGLVAEDDTARWPVASYGMSSFNRWRLCAVLTVAQGSGNWQRIRAAAHGATPLSQLIRESRSPLSAPPLLPILCRGTTLYPLSNAQFSIFVLWRSLRRWHFDSS